MSKGYIVVRTKKEQISICSQGQKPFIGTLAQAKDHADFLKSVNKECDYVVYTIAPLATKGVVTERYSGEAQPEKKRAKTNKVRK